MTMTIKTVRTKGASGIGEFQLIAGLFLSLGLFAVSAGLAQGETQQNPTPAKNGAPSLQQPSGSAGAATPAVAPIDPQEQAAYKAFYDASPQDADKKIQMGEDFVAKYPASRYDEGVYANLVQLYVPKQAWDKFYAASDKALALNPDDVGVLTTVGWVIPHTYDPNDPNAAKNLTKAEVDEKHAIEVLGTMAKPANVTDEQFTEFKAEDLAVAHSGLGLVYFRRQQFDDSARELKQATQAAAHPDPTDFYVLGVDLQNLKQNSDAADAFDKCAQIPGGLQPECKRRSDAAKQAK